jgi:amino acid transporter
LQVQLRKELGLRDLVLAQVLCVVGSSWVGVAAKLGKAHVAFWLGAMLLFYVPLAIVVIYLNKLMPLEGGLYQWAKFGFNQFTGFLIAWNLWVYAITSVSAILFTVPTDVGYMIGPSGRCIMIISAYAILLALPIWALLNGSLSSFQPIPWQTPKPSWVGLAIFGQMCVGGLSGFEYIAILAGECKSADRTVGQSVTISAPIISLMFILGTSSVLAFVGDRPIDLIGPIPQTFRIVFGTAGLGAMIAPLAILLLMVRSVASSSLLFTGLSRLPMTAGWDNLLPSWFTKLHPRWLTPVNSILFVAVLILAFILLSMLGVEEQEANQLLSNASTVHYGIAYVALFLLPLIGSRALRERLPGWLKIAAIAGFCSSVVAVFIGLYPIIDVVSPREYAAKIGGTVIVSNVIGLLIYSLGTRRQAAG